MSGATMLPHDWFPRPLPANVVIGERSWFHSSYAFLHYRSQRACGVRVGYDSGIYRGTFFDLGPEGEVEIGNYTTIVGAIISTNGRIFIGDYAFLSHEVVLADTSWAKPAEAQPLNNQLLAISISIGKNSWIGARVLLLSGACVGEGAIVGAGSFVDFEVPPYAIVAGNPARIVGSTREDNHC